MSFTCSTCKKDYDPQQLDYIGKYISQWSGKEHLTLRCTYCAAEKDDLYFEHEKKQAKWIELSATHPRIFNVYDGLDATGREVYKPAAVAGGVGDGWFDIVSEASDRIEAVLDTYPEGTILHFAQMKEKFGGLRWYTTGLPSRNKKERILRELSTKWNKFLKNSRWPKSKHWRKVLSVKVSYDAGGVFDIITWAENKSYETCEVCGKPGTLREGGWIKTLCDEHT